MRTTSAACGSLHDHHGEVRVAFGSHNLRLAHAITYARHVGVPDNGFEIQMIYGMADSMHEAIKALGHRLRVYVPVGELVPGMAYLVRRLLENTSNESSSCATASPRVERWTICWCRPRSTSPGPPDEP